MDRPLVLVNAEEEPGDRRRLLLPARYAEALWRAGGAPLVLPALPDALDTLLERADGLLLAGGDDFDTEPLGLGPTHPRAKPVPAGKQAFDLGLVQRALRRGLPCLGICYGMQLLGLAGGGGLLQHLPEDRPGSREHSGGVRHPVELAAGSKLRSVFGVERVEVVSRHHQALADVAAPWRVSARDDEGLIEGIELPGEDFAVGVQWHPELDDLDGPQARLFASFVAAAKATRERREGALAR